MHEVFPFNSHPLQAQFPSNTAGYRPIPCWELSQMDETYKTNKEISTEIQSALDWA
jgi:hypothetical protein